VDVEGSIFFFQAEDGIRDRNVTGVQTCALPILYKRADAGEAHYVRVLEDTGDIMGIALTNLIHIMNPEKIVLGGGVMNAKKFLLPPIKETIANQALTADAKQTAIAVSELGDDATLLGAVSLFLVEVFALK